jgi:hypothetical protein
MDVDQTTQPTIDRIDKMNDQIDLPAVSMAYEKVQDIANRAVTAARRESYMPPVQHAGVAVREEKQG